MEPKDEDNKRYKEQFKKRRSSRINLFIFAIVFLLIVGIFILPVMDMLGVSRLAWAPVIYIVMFGVIIAIAVIWRCPVCNGLLGDVFTTKYCAKCGFNFSEDGKRINKK